ncbi:chitinase [Actinoallomurus sp. NPDC050550]|uniref:chitinase n=1 Tax=Actinoallomurus sp. NPDC050550 TaxID=3154937 RepID=UPI003411145F
MSWARRVAAVTVAACVAGLGLTGTASARERAVPPHVFAPYVETYLPDSPAALAEQSGAKYLTLAFLQTAAPGSCTLTWNGDANAPVSWSVYGDDITAIRRAGGDVIPSFGGYGADTTNTEIADSCTDAKAIAAAYEKVITTYGVTRLDFDVEADSLNNTAAIDRRNKAITLVQDWARRHGRTVQFVYTLPTFTTGLSAPGVALLQNAEQNHAKISVVNIMTFDYYDNQPHEMAQDTVKAATGLVGQLKAIHPNASLRQLWSQVGVTEMVGIDDFGPAETFTTGDAVQVEHWAAEQGIAELSFWAMQRDNGGCVGTGGSNTCSGVAQQPWQFSHTFIPFTGRA